jgi:hypothetical protein
LLREEELLFAKDTKYLIQANLAHVVVVQEPLVKLIITLLDEVDISSFFTHICKDTKKVRG